MGVEKLIAKLTNSNNPRELYEIPVDLCMGSVDFHLLGGKAAETDLANQLGLLVDMTLKYLIDEQHTRYLELEQLSARLELLKGSERPFYKETAPALGNAIKQRMGDASEQGMPELLKKWKVISILSPSKFKAVYDQEYENRQRGTESDT